MPFGKKNPQQNERDTDEKDETDKNPGGAVGGLSTGLSGSISSLDSDSDFDDEDEKKKKKKKGLIGGSLSNLSRMALDEEDKKLKKRVKEARNNEPGWKENWEQYKHSKPGGLFSRKKRRNYKLECSLTFLIQKCVRVTLSPQNLSFTDFCNHIDNTGCSSDLIGYKLMTKLKDLDRRFKVSETSSTSKLLNECSVCNIKGDKLVLCEVLILCYKQFLKDFSNVSKKTKQQLKKEEHDIKKASLTFPQIALIKKIADTIISTKQKLFIRLLSVRFYKTVTDGFRSHSFPLTQPEGECLYIIEGLIHNGCNVQETEDAILDNSNHCSTIFIEVLLKIIKYFVTGTHSSDFQPKDDNSDKGATGGAFDMLSTLGRPTITDTSGKEGLKKPEDIYAAIKKGPKKTSGGIYADLDHGSHPSKGPAPIPIISDSVIYSPIQHEDGNKQEPLPPIDYIPQESSDRPKDLITMLKRLSIRDASEGTSNRSFPAAAVNPNPSPLPPSNLGPDFVPFLAPDGGRRKNNIPLVPDSGKNPFTAGRHPGARPKNEPFMLEDGGRNPNWKPISTPHSTYPGNNSNTSLSGFLPKGHKPGPDIPDRSKRRHLPPKPIPKPRNLMNFNIDKTDDSDDSD